MVALADFRVQLVSPVAAPPLAAIAFVQQFAQPLAFAIAPAQSFHLYWERIKLVALAP